MKAEEGKWLARNLDKKQVEKELEEEVERIREEKRREVEEQRRAAL